MSLDSCQEVKLPVIEDRRGNLSFIEGRTHIPFDIARVYYLYDVPGGASRGGHAHRKLEQLVVVVSGSCDFVLDDGHMKKRYSLNRACNGLYICPMVWREIENFSTGTVCMVLASEVYKEEDYIRDYSEFTRMVG